MKELIRSIVPRTVRNWVRQPQRSVRYLRDRISYAIKGPDSVTIASDWTVHCHPAAREHFEVFRNDPSQRAELQWFIRYCKPEMQLLDVGAHYGLMTLAARHYGGDSVRVVCVEASPKAVGILEKNIAANNIHSNVRIMNVALGASDGYMHMLSTGPPGSDYFVSAPKTRKDTIAVPQTTIGSVILQTGIRPTHLKLDIEGFEYEAIVGGKAALAEFKPILFLELHGRYLHARGCDPSQIINDLRTCGYTQFEEQGKHLSESDFIGRTSECRIVCFAN